MTIYIEFENEDGTCDEYEFTSVSVAIDEETRDNPYNCDIDFKKIFKNGVEVGEVSDAVIEQFLDAAVAEAKS